MARLLPLFLCLVFITSACASHHGPAYELAGHDGITPAPSLEADDTENEPELVVKASPPKQAPRYDAAPVAVSDSSPSSKVKVTLYFETSSDQPTASSALDLETLGRILTGNPHATALIQGHTDSVGSAQANLRLSQSRAEAIKSLVAAQYGVAEQRLTAQGKGESEPVADNANPEGRGLNRRVCVIIQDLDMSASLGQRSSPIEEAKNATSDKKARYDEGVAAFNQGEYQKAYDIFSQLLREYPEDGNINFYLGRSAFALKEYPLALFAYERILSQRPDADRVRLEKAVTHAAMGQNDLAIQEYKTVLEHDPPETVRNNILAQLEQLERKQEVVEFHGSASVGWFNDNNVNVGPSSRGVDTILGQVVLNEGALPKEDNGLAASAELTVQVALDGNKHWYAVAGGSHYQKRHFEETDYDLTSSRGTAGIKGVFGRHLFLLRGKYQHLDYDNQALLDIWGPDLTYLYMLAPKTQIIATAVIEARDHQQNDDRDGSYLSGGTYLRHYFGPVNHMVMAGGRIFRENTGKARYTNQGWELSGSLLLNLPEDFDFTLGAAYRRTAYEGPPSVLASNDRDDTQLRMNLGLSKELWEGLKISGNLDITDNGSNFDIYDYTKYVPSITLSYSF